VNNRNDQQKNKKNKKKEKREESRRGEGYGNGVYGQRYWDRNVSNPAES